MTKHIDAIPERFAALQSVKATAAECHVSPKTVIKVLATHGIAATEQAERVQAMAQHMTIDEIAADLKISPRTVQAYLPYARGTYLSDSKSANAVRIQQWRSKRKQGEQTND